MTTQPCAYCEQPITEESYTNKWFPNQKKWLPVHDIHLQINKRTKEGGGNATEIRRNSEDRTAEPFGTDQE